MLDFDSKTVVRALCGCFLLLSACDQPQGPEDQEFRFETNQCVTINSGSQGTKLVAGGHGPFPWDPDGDPFAELSEAPDEWVRALHDDVRGNVEAVLVGNFERNGRIGDCPRACKYEGMGFEGGGCVVSSEFSFGEIDYAEPDYAGNPRYSVPVSAQVEVGCSCVD